MSRTAMYEKHHGEELRKAKEYYRSDYIWIELFKNALRVTIAYAIGVMLWAGYHLDMVIARLNTMQIRGMVTGFLIFYFLFLSLTMVITNIMAMRASIMTAAQHTPAHIAPPHDGLYISPN